MHAVNLIFPHQLFKNSPIIQNGLAVYLVEEFLFFQQYPFHKQKIAFHRATMKYYEHYLTSKGVQVNYINAQNEFSDVRQLITALSKQDIKILHYIDTIDHWLEKRIQSSADKTHIECIKHPSLLFLNTKEELQTFFKPEKKKFFQTKFYIWQRKQRNLLLDGAQRPLGGKWSFDAENRKKYPKNKVSPPIEYPPTDPFFHEAKNYVVNYFSKNPGELASTPLYPTNYASTQQWLHQFLHARFAEFGPYEDAIVAEQSLLHHSMLTPMLNAPHYTYLLLCANLKVF